MTDADAKSAILAQWKAEAPLTLDRAKEIAQDILSGRQLNDFLKWMDKFGAQVLERLGHA